MFRVNLDRSQDDGYAWRIDLVVPAIVFAALIIKANVIQGREKGRRSRAKIRFAEKAPH